MTPFLDPVMAAERVPDCKTGGGGVVVEQRSCTLSG